MEGVASHQAGVRVEQLSRPVEDFNGDREDVREDRPRAVVDLSPLVPPVQRAVAIEEFLERLGIDHRFDLAERDGFEERQAGRLVRMIRAGGVHENDGVDQDHGASVSAAGTDSRFISPGSPTGSARAASARTASSRSSGEAMPYCRMQALRMSSPRLTPSAAAMRVSSW